MTAEELMTVPTGEIMNELLRRQSVVLMVLYSDAPPPASKYLLAMRLEGSRRAAVELSEFVRQKIMAALDDARPRTEDDAE